MLIIRDAELERLSTYHSAPNALPGSLQQLRLTESSHSVAAELRFLPRDLSGLKDLRHLQLTVHEYMGFLDLPTGCAIISPASIQAL